MLTAKSKLLPALALLGAACSGDPGTTPDAGAGDVDAAANTSGLTIRLTANPSLGDFDGDFAPTLDEISIELADFRAIGDSAPGDDRTRIATFALSFSDSDTQSVRFDSAPIGVYSRVRARIDRALLRGTCVVQSQTMTWEIETEPPGGLELDISVNAVDLEQGAEAAIMLDVELDRPYDEVNWDQLTPTLGVLRVDDSFRDIGEVRKKLRDSFRSDSSSDDT